MGMTQSTPSFSATARSFWSKPEGKFGMIVLGGIGLAVGVTVFMALPAILSFLTAVVASTIELAALVGVVVVGGAIAINPKVHMLVRNCFQLSCRWATGLVINVDPIGILRNNIDNMRKQKVLFDNAVSQLAGSKQRLVSDIAKNNADIAHQHALAQQAQKQVDFLQHQLDATTDPDKRQDVSLQIQKMGMQKQGYEQTAGIQINTIQNEQPLLDQTNKMYVALSRMQSLADFKIDFLSQQADLLSKRRDMILASQKGLRAAGAIVKGDPAQLALVDQTVDFLNNEADDTIGAMNDFNRWSDKYLTDQDLQNGANAAEAEQKFGELESKLKAPALPGVVVPVTSSVVSVSSTSSSSYDDAFRS